MLPSLLAEQLPSPTVLCASNPFVSARGGKEEEEEEGKRTETTKRQKAILVLKGKQDHNLMVDLRIREFLGHRTCFLERCCEREREREGFSEGGERGEGRERGTDGPHVCVCEGWEESESEEEVEVGGGEEHCRLLAWVWEVPRSADWKREGGRRSGVCCEQLWCRK